MPGINYDVNLKAGGFTAGINEALAGVGALGGKLLGLVGIAGAVAGALAGVKKAVGGAAGLETTTIAFETLLGSAAKAKSLLGELKQLGASTPLEFPELTDAGRKLIAFGVAADVVTDTLRRIGDVATGIQAPLGEIAEIYGKARVQGTLFAEDINQLTGRGIPVIQEFARILGVSEGEVKKLASEGKITFGLLERAFVNLTDKGGKFSGMMGKQAETTAGLWSTLKDSINDVFTTLGQPLNDSLKPFLKQAIEVVNQVKEAAANLLYTLQAALKEGNLGALLKSQLMRGVKEVGNFLRAVMIGAGSALVEAAAVAWESLSKLPDLMYAAGMNLLGGAQVLLKGEFWNGVALQMTSIGLRFAAAIGDGLAPVMDQLIALVNQVRAAFGKEAIKGPNLGSVGQVAGVMAGVADRGAAESFVKAMAGVQRYNAPEYDGLEVMFGRVLNAFESGFKGAGDGFNTRVEEDAWSRWRDLGSMQRKKDEAAARANEKQEKAASKQALAAEAVGRAAKLMERLFGAPEEGSGRIRTFNRAESATRRFLRRSKADQDGSLSDFLGPIDADLKRSVGRNLNLARLYRETQRDDKSGRAQEKLLSRIDHNTRETAQQLAKFQPA
jgi:tape measure domain-containing protein